MSGPLPDETDALVARLNALGLALTEVLREARLPLEECVVVLTRMLASVCVQEENPAEHAEAVGLMLREMVDSWMRRKDGAS